MKTMEQVAHDLRVTYGDLTALLAEQEDVESGLLRAQTELSNARSRAILETEPKQLGANEAIREARLAELTSAERHALHTLEARRVTVRYRVEVARLNVDHARANLRLLEVEAALPPARLAA